MIKGLTEDNQNHSGCSKKITAAAILTSIGHYGKATIFWLESSVYSCNKEATIVYYAKPIESCAYILKVGFSN